MDTHTNNNSPDNGGFSSGSVEEAMKAITERQDSNHLAATRDDVVDERPQDAADTGEVEQPTGVDSAETEEVTEGVESQNEEAEPVLASDTSFVEMDGERISIEDLKNGFLRHSDYTRKSQELAEQRKVYEANQTGIDTVRGEAIQALSTMRDNLVAQLQLEEVPDFEQLIADGDAAEFQQQQYKWQKRMNALAKIDAERQQLVAQASERREAIFAEETRKGRIELARLHPELATDKAVSGRFKEFVYGLGFSTEDLEGVTNPAIFSLAYDAMRYREGQAQKAQAVKTIEAKPKMVPTGSAAPQANADENARRKAREAFKNDGSLEGAIAYMNSKSRK